MLIPPDVVTSMGVATANENRFHIIYEAEPGVADLAGTPIPVTDIETDYADQEDWTQSRGEGFLDDVWSARTRAWTELSGNLTPEYAQMFWRFMAIYGMPEPNPVTGTVTINGESVAYTEYEWRLNSFGRTDRALFSINWGRLYAAKLATHGFIQAMTIRNSRSGETDGDITIMARNAGSGEIMIGAGTNEKVTITGTAYSGSATIVAPNTKLGTGGNVVIPNNCTPAQARALFGANPAIRSVNNIRLSGTGMVSGTGTLIIEFINDLALTNIANLTSATSGIGIATTTGGSLTPIEIPEPVGILPGDWKVFNALDLDELGDLDFAEDFMKTVDSHEITYADLVNAYWTEDGEISFSNHVDGIRQIGFSVTMEYSEDPAHECYLLEQEAIACIAKKRWFLFLAESACTAFRVQFGIHGSVSDTRTYGDEDNVYRKTFVYTQKVNTISGEGYSNFVKLRVPTP